MYGVPRKCSVSHFGCRHHFLPRKKSRSRLHKKDTVLFFHRSSRQEKIRSTYDTTICCSITSLTSSILELLPNHTPTILFSSTMSQQGPPPVHPSATMEVHSNLPVIPPSPLLVKRVIERTSYEESASWATEDLRTSVMNFPPRMSPKVPATKTVATSPTTTRRQRVRQVSLNSFDGTPFFASNNNDHHADQQQQPHKRVSPKASLFDDTLC